MTLSNNDAFANCELSTSELEAISAGIVITHGPNPPMRGAHGEGHHHHPHQPLQPPRYYPGGGPNAPGLQIHH